MRHNFTYPPKFGVVSIMMSDMNWLSVICGQKNLEKPKENRDETRIL
ncbi:MAG: hypothetical protein HW415_1063 [Deltaproteobacteria bacterium]|nr:hypothetical protein [Deltaproteobacteria bacterium]